MVRKSIKYLFNFLLIYLGVNFSIYAVNWLDQTYSLDVIKEEIKRTEAIVQTLDSDNQEGQGNNGEYGSFSEKLTELKKLENILMRIERLEPMESSEADTSKTSTDIKSIVEQSIAKLPPDKLEFSKSLLSELEVKKKSLEDLQDQSRQALERMEKSPELINLENKKASDLEAELAKLNANNNNLASATNALWGVKREIAELKYASTQEMIKLYNKQVEIDKINIPVIGDKIYFQQRIVDELNKHFEKSLEAKDSDLAMKLEKLHQEASAGVNQSQYDLKTPDGVFLNNLSKEVDNLQSEILLLEKALSKTQKDFLSFEKVFKIEKENFKNLQDYVSKAGSSGRAAQRLKRNFERVKDVKLKQFDFEGDLERKIDIHRARRFDVDHNLLVFRDREMEKAAEVSTFIPSEKQTVFMDNVTELLSTLYERRIQLREVLVKIINLEIKFMNAYYERTSNLEELEAFVQARIFWIQDGEPLSLSNVTNIYEESLSLKNRLLGFTARQSSRFLTETFGSMFKIALAISVFIILPILLYLFAKYLSSAAINKLNRQIWSLSQSRRLLISLIPQVFIVCAIGFYFWVSLKYLLSISYQSNFFPILLLAEFWFFLGLFFVSAFVVQVLFGPNKIFDKFELTEKSVIEQLLKVFSLWNISYLVFLAPSLALAEVDHGYKSISRLGVFAFSLSIFSGFLILVNKKSPAMELLRNKAAPFLKDNINKLKNLSIIFLVFIFGMFIMGYHFGAYWLLTNSFISVLTLSLLYVLNKKTLVYFESLLRKPRQDDNEELKDQREKSRKNLRFYVKVIYTTISIFLLAKYWGLNEKALQAFDEISIFSFDFASGLVTISLADLLKSALSVFITVFFFRHVNFILDITLFQRKSLDSGLKYALVTISRYMILFIGVVFTLANLHFSLSSVSWLMAAVGLGLGFGLQEIVSNFVCGMIILIERPIRVGDTIGLVNMTGVVQKINIRATTVMNWDRQEVIVPNKDLITKEVINWTLADDVIRVVVPIGVAYGSDTEKVKEILLEEVKKIVFVLNKPNPEVYFMAHGESSLDFEIRVYLRDPLKRWIVMDEINSRVNRALKENHIEIPFPQRDLHLKSINENIRLKS